MRPTPRLLLVLCLVLGLAPAASAAPATGTHSENLKWIDNIGYEARNGSTPNYGTDIEFAQLKVRGRLRDYALAGSYRNGLHIVDITDPEDAEVVGIYDCGVTQGDVQVFTREDLKGRTFVTYTSDTTGDGTSTCYREAEALYGRSLRKANGSGRNGTFIADITDPTAPFTVGFVEVAKGSHNQTVHPSGRYLYNSNSDLITSVGTQAIEVFDITDFLAPRKVTDLALPPRPGLGTESHDITFNSDGTRAYSAALSQTVIIDTTDPAQPTIVSSFVDPAINVEHQADPFTLSAPDGTERDFLIVEDEYAGAAGGPHCPSGGVHVYETTGELEASPQKVGYWNISDARATTSATGRCTAHVFDIHEDEAIMTIAYYNGGVRIVDLSGLASGTLNTSLGSTAPLGGMRELAFYRFSNSDTWSVKAPQFHPVDGDFYVYANDIARGLDIFKFSADAAPSTSGGTWMTPAQALRALPRAASAELAAYQPYCLLGQA